MTYVAVCWQVFWRTPVIEPSDLTNTPAEVIQLAKEEMAPRLNPEPFEWSAAKYLLSHPTEAGPRQIDIICVEDENGKDRKSVV